MTKIPHISNVDELVFKEYSQSEVQEFLYQCHEKGYVNFISAYRDGNSKPYFEHLIKPGLTISGYEFLNSLYASNALKNARFAKISILSLSSFILFSSP